MSVPAATTDILARLIGFETVSKDTNLSLIEWADHYLRGLGAQTDITTNGDGTKANLFATIGPDIDGGVVLSGHTDVVPVEGQDWSSDPFAAAERDGAIYGRGACDMKGFLACALGLAPRFAEADLARPLHQALSYDEETGCLGAPVMLARLAETGRKPGACIVGEPTAMKVIEGHKGCHEYTTRFQGLEGHGSMPDAGVNAAEYAVRYVAELIATADQMKARAPEGSPFDPPWTTISTGAIRGGIAHNVIPNQCEVDWEFRPVTPEDTAYVKDRIWSYAESVLLPAMRAVHPAADIQTEVVGEVTGLEPLPDSRAVELVAQLTGSNVTGTVPFGTEAGLFQALGIHTVVCGPGSIEQAHKPDEFVTLDQLSQCLAMIERLLPRLSV